MLQTLKYNSTMPSAVSTATALTAVPTAGTARKYADLTRSRNLPFYILTDSEQKEKAGRILVSAHNELVNVDSLSQEHPHYINCNLTATYDPRYANTTDLIATAAGLLSMLLSKENQADTQLVIERILSGEG